MELAPDELVESPMGDPDLGWNYNSFSVVKEKATYCLLGQLSHIARLQRFCRGATTLSLGGRGSRREGLPHLTQT